MSRAATVFFAGLLLGPLAGATSAQEPPSTPPAPLAPEGTDGVDYPLGRLGLRDVALPGEPFKLVDLSYDVSDTVRTTQAFATRLKVKGWGYFGAAFEGERREVTWTSQRLALSAAGENGAYDLSGSFRAHRFIVSTDAQTGGTEGSGWLVRPSLSVRLSRDLEVLGQLEGDSRRPYDHLLRSASAGFLWQRGVGFEATGEYAHARVGTDAGFENTQDTGALALIGQVGRAEISGEASLEDVEGRFPHRDGEVAAAARVQVLARLLAEGGARLRLERGAGLQGHEYRGALTWFGRRFYLPRSGEAARRTLVLARAATAMGYNERRVYTDDERRSQRERLSLSRRNEELRGDIEALYGAQVAERPVPLLGVELIDAADSLTGVGTRTVRASVGVPWPPAWPWQANEASVPFLHLDLERLRQTSGTGFPAITNTASLSVALNREMDLVLLWRRADPTSLDLIRGIGQRRTIELNYVYAFGR
jgi:hypothetical protein